MIEAYNTTSAAVTAGAQAPLSASDTYCDKDNLTLNGNTITVNEPGTYLISADFVFTPTDTSAAVQMLVNGAVVPQTLRQVTATADAVTALHTQHVINVPCVCRISGVAIAFVYPNAGTQSVANVIVQRVR